MADEFPKPGTKVTRRIRGKSETRTVLDQTLGGHVVFVRGRTRGRDLWREYGDHCTLDEWNAWAKRKAKR
ncbi:MAG: hypothetical protein KGI71_05795 [Patescibacteria group bacterium]|nr:hypothetical protein [Patescibacteria group bacterium]